MLEAQARRRRAEGGPWWSSTWPMVGLLIALVLLAPLAYRAKYRDRIMPGVSVAGIPVGGIAPADAVARLQQAGLDPEARVVVRIGEERTEIPAAESGLALDTRATVEDAYRIGRGRAFPAAFLAALRARALGTDRRSASRSTAPSPRKPSPGSR